MVAVLGYVCLLGASPAQAAFGFSALDLAFTQGNGSPATQAGSHPFAWVTSFELNTVGPPGEETPDEALRDLRIQLPEGLVGTPGMVPRCSQADFVAEACPSGAEVGEIALQTDSPETEGQLFQLYNLEPTPGSAAELGFIAVYVPVRIRIRIDPEPPHNLVASIDGASQAAAFFGAELTIYGTPGGEPFLTLPRSCTGPLTTVFEAGSWEQLGVWAPPAIALTHDDSDPPQPLGLDGCEGLDFEPNVEMGPSAKAAGAASGFDFSLDLPNPGIVSATGIANADLREAVLALPAGMAINAAVAEGLAACSPADLARETFDSDPGAGCPNGSKLGTAEVETPLLDEAVSGSVFLAQPDDPATPAPGAENPFDSLFALYAVFKDPARGIVVKQPIRLDADPQDGRLTARATGIPQLPFARLELHLRGGARSPLVTPPACGTHETRYSLTPSSGAAAVAEGVPFELTQDCASPRFQPTLSAGAVDPRAGVASAYVLDFTRGDREQNLLGAELTLPQGVSANLASVATCPDGLVAARACPADSRVGSVRLAVGTGEAPVWVPPAAEAPGSIFLAGPYGGAPFSFAVVVPGRAGPLDLGSVALRAPVFVDPATAQARIRIDELPQILRGVPIAYRNIRLVLDRPGFVNNPTDCTASAVRAAIASTAGAVATAAKRFQVGECGRLAFEPRLALRMKGPTHRGAHPEVRAVLRARPGDANLERATATLPGTELLDSRRIRGICARAQFDAESCPADSIYGVARAWSPALRRPLRGPVYLRESKSRLPDLVADLGGELDLHLTARLDAVGGRLRLGFRALPDAPLSKVVLRLAGGKRGLLVNSGGVCSRRHRVAAAFLAQNGKRHHARPVFRTGCGGHD